MHEVNDRSRGTADQRDGQALLLEVIDNAVKSYLKTP